MSNLPTLKRLVIGVGIGFNVERISGRTFEIRVLKFANSGHLDSPDSLISRLQKIGNRDRGLFENSLAADGTPAFENPHESTRFQREATLAAFVNAHDVPNIGRIRVEPAHYYFTRRDVLKQRAFPRQGYEIVGKRQIGP